MDDTGCLIKPDAPNAVKLESFIFDAMPLAKRTMVLEGDRSSIFAPTKNPTGVDSVESCREMLIERDAKRLEAAGVRIPRTADGRVDAKIELSPLAVFDDEDAAAYARLARTHRDRPRRGTLAGLTEAALEEHFPER